MKILICMAFLCTAVFAARAQDIKGKWYEKLSQMPGGYSDLYDLEFDFKSDRPIAGQAYSYLLPKLHERLVFYGRFDGDSIRLKEDSMQVIQEIVPFPWFMCIKNFNVAYRRVGSREYLQGRWDGVGKGDRTNICVPGAVILSRTKEDLKFFLDSIHKPIPPPAPPAEPIAEFTSSFNNTAITKITEIEVNNTSLEIRLRDYLEVDNDTVSIFLDRKILSKNVRIDKKAVSVKFNIDKAVPLHELLLFAENLGRIPPNTSEMFVIDGKKSYRVMIESDKEKTAAVYLRYKPMVQ